MAQDALPTDFDVIVLGTGLPESIVASACARSGLSVLHLDSNDYYGSTWASFHLKSIGEWADEQMKDTNGTDGNPTADFSHHLLPGERLELVSPARRKVIKNVQHSWHVENAPQPPAAELKEEKTTATVGEPNDSVEQSSTAAVESPTVPQETQLAPTDAKDPQTTTLPSAETTVPSAETTVPSAETAVPRWTRDRVEKDWRRFNLDLAPKVLRARGPMVQILCQSEVSRYAEFKCVDRFLCSGEHGNLHQVPCSRAEIFQTDAIGVMDKRRLMKFLTFALNWENEPEEYRGFEDKPLKEFLESKGLTGLLQSYISDTIASLQTNPNTVEGLRAVNKFLTSVGRYGNSPFLWTLYGSGELPQCFCRLCAVYGGIYCLRHSVDYLIINGDNRCTAVVTNGQRINCQFLIADQSYLPEEFVHQRKSVTAVQRAVLITDRPLEASDDKEHITLLNLANDDNLGTVHLLEAGFGACIAPKDLYVVHLTAACSSAYNASIEQPLSKIVHKYFSTSDDVTSDNVASLANRPRLLWILYFDVVTEMDVNKETIPSNIGVVCLPDATLDYETTVESAKELFALFWPDRDFLPFALPKEEEDEDEAQHEDVAGPENTQTEQSSTADTAENSTEHRDEAKAESVTEAKSE